MPGNRETDRAAVLAAIRAAVTASLQDQSQAEAAIRQAAAAILGRPDDGQALALLKEAERRVGRRAACGAVARKLCPGEPLEQETVAHWLREVRRRHETERVPVAALAAE